MIRHEQLLEQYEEALFALLMEENAPKWEEELEKELTALEADPAAAVSPENDRRNVVTIRSALAQEGDRQRRNREGRGRLRPLLAAACLALAFLVGGFFGPQLAREGALSALLAGIGVEMPQKTLELEVKWLPEGYQLAGESWGEDFRIQTYQNHRGGRLVVSRHGPKWTVEPVPDAEEVDILDHPAKLAWLGQEGWQVLWSDGENWQIEVKARDLSREDVIKFCEKLKY